MAITGMTTPQGWISRPRRFSLIISPQSAAGGCRPKPRKLRAEMSAIEKVRRRLASTTSGLVTFGSTSPKRIFVRGHADPLGGADEVALDDVERCAANDSGNAGSGRDADHEDEQPQLGPDGRHGDEREDDLWEGEDDVHRPHEHVVEDVAGVRGHEPDRHSEDDAESGREDRERENGPPAPEKAAENVAAEVVGAEERVRGRLLVRERRRTRSARTARRRARSARSRRGAGRARARSSSAPAARPPRGGRPRDGAASAARRPVPGAATVVIEAPSARGG